VVDAKQVKPTTFKLSSIEHHAVAHANQFVPGGIYKVQFNWQNQYKYSGVTPLNIRASDNSVFYQVP
jgi:hypothetical protein